MNKFIINVSFLFLLLLSSLIHAGDTGWLRAGVRVWYVGGDTALASEADLIDQIDGLTATVIQQQSSANWTNPELPKTLVCDNAVSEGTFWISPVKLAALAVLDQATWMTIEGTVKDRIAYTLNTLPFPVTLPIEALFKVNPQRQIVYLRTKDGSDYYFDLETGLLLSRTGLFLGNRLTMTLSEINYNFSTRKAFAEDDGPHSAYKGYFKASYPGFPDTKGFRYISQVLSRYGNLIKTDLDSYLTNVNSGQTESASSELLYNGDSQQAFIRTKGDTAWVQNGDHLFWWIPAGDLLKQSIVVWDMTLNRDGVSAGMVTFLTALTTAQTAFTSLTFDSGGFLTDAVLTSTTMFMTIRSPDDPTKVMRVDGRSYYENQMKQAVPSGVPLVTPTGTVTPTPTPTPSGGCSQVGVTFMVVFLAAGLCLIRVKAEE